MFIDRTDINGIIFLMLIDNNTPISIAEIVPVGDDEPLTSNEPDLIDKGFLLTDPKPAIKHKQNIFKDICDLTGTWFPNIDSAIESIQTTWNANLK
jgi:hypothetical protein